MAQKARRREERPSRTGVRAEHISNSKKRVGEKVDPFKEADLLNGNINDYNTNEDNPESPLHEYVFPPKLIVKADAAID